jgi:calcineurin-like phosphoesterase family protein
MGPWPFICRERGLSRLNPCTRPVAVAHLPWRFVCQPRQKILAGVVSAFVILRSEMLRILHLSDIHFGQGKEGEQPHLEDVREQLIGDLATLLGDTKSLDLILINGDVAHAGKKLEYDSAVAWIDRLIAVGRCDVNAVLSIPGNHDVDVELISLAARLAHAQLRNSKPETVRHLLHDYTAERDEVNSIFPKLRTYVDFARGYDSEFESRVNPRWIRYREIRPGLRLRIVGMCSVQVSDLDDRPGTMILGDKQYIFPEDKGLITLVLVHHPLAWFLDKVDAQAHIWNRSSILLTGHEHLPGLNKITALSGEERIEISAGATTDTKSDAPFEFAYNLLELDLQDSTGLLSITVWPRVWSIKKPSFGSDISKTGGPDSRSLTIDCRLEPPPAASSARTAEKVLSQGTAMQRDETADFGRLKHFFWHYLTWDQRITVLVRAAVLPRSVENRLPQTIELEALLRAKDTGKLASVWEDVMSFVPADKKKPNPFPR